MSLQAGLKRVLTEYAVAVKLPFTDNTLAAFIRHDLPHSVENQLGDNNRYLVAGSPGRGNWAQVPWVAIFDRFITETAQDGIYVVYLFKEDLSGIYLSLNQGVTTIKDIYGSDAKAALAARASDYLAKIGDVPEGFVTGPLDLGVTDPGGLGAFYGKGSICAKYYGRAEIPDDLSLASDLNQILGLYLALATKELVPSSEGPEEDDEAGLNIEDLTRLREHKRIERNRSLSKKAKTALGFTCAACGFNFQEKYGEIGTRFIEAHHLTPLHSLKGRKIKLDPKKDFAVLCSNCHRMIHKTDVVGDVAEFRRLHIMK